MDVTSPNINLPKDSFLASLSSSWLIPPSELEEFISVHADKDALGLASALVESGAITSFQLDAISQGRPSDLKIGNYDILDKLGAGGMGTVYKARHRKMKRIVALKVLSKTLCKDELFVQRFQREVETIARLGHPNIVMAYDADEAEVGHFLVMEFVDGRDLTSLVETSHPVQMAVAVDCILQAARGLSFAHSQGVVHRDIKPGNLLRDASGVVKVTDLGLARLNSGDAESSEDRGITQAGGVLGTVDYMAPEQAVDSTAIDQRADIYSLGATLHFLLTGKPPFSGSSIMSVLLKHREAPIPSLRETRPDVPAEVDAIFQRMMAKKAEQRQQSMAEVAAELESLAAGLGYITAAELRTATVPATISSGSSVVINRSDSPTKVEMPKEDHSSVVVVEPSRVQAGIVRKYLEAQDVVVPIVVGTGEAAIAAVRQHNPTGIVSALHLSDMSGVELAKQIRAEIPGRRPGFVLISSESDGSDAGTLSSLDRVVAIQKPFSVEQLIQAVSLVTGKSVSIKSTAVSITGLSGSRPGSGSLSIAKPKIDRAALRVLIVDDSSAARMNERVVLQGLGFTQFSEAADGAQAIAAATREGFDMIVTDYNIPLMDGYALVSYLKQTPVTSKIPIVMVTTESSPEILDPVRNLGVVAIFDKAFAAAAVQPIMEKLFG